MIGMRNNENTLQSIYLKIMIFYLIKTDFAYYPFSDEFP